MRPASFVSASMYQRGSVASTALAFGLARSTGRRRSRVSGDQSIRPSRGGPSRSAAPISGWPACLPRLRPEKKRPVASSFGTMAAPFGPLRTKLPSASFGMRPGVRARRIVRSSSETNLRGIRKRRVARVPAFDIADRPVDCEARLEYVEYGLRAVFRGGERVSQCIRGLRLRRARNRARGPGSGNARAEPVQPIRDLGTQFAFLLRRRSQIREQQGSDVLAVDSDRTRAHAVDRHASAHQGEMQFHHIR